MGLKEVLISKDEIILLENGRDKSGEITCRWIIYLSSGQCFSTCRSAFLVGNILQRGNVKCNQDGVGRESTHRLDFLKEVSSVLYDHLHQRMKVEIYKV